MSIHSQSVSEIARGEELLPCPFCGGEAVHDYVETYSTDSSFWVIRCQSCYAMMYASETLRADEIQAWNTRAIDSATAAKEREIGDLQACLATLNEERNSFIAFANTLPRERRPVLVGPIQVSKWHIEALQARVRDLEQQLQKANEDFHELAAHNHATRPIKP